MSKEQIAKSKTPKQNSAFSAPPRLRVRNWGINIIVFFHFSFFIFNLYAQSTAQEIETLLETNAVTYAQATRFVLEASNTIAVENHEEAFRYANEQGWLPRNAAATDTARLDGVSRLLLESFGVRGGLMYTITKAPHYAYLELVYRNIIQGRVIGSTPVSGEYLLFITSRMLSLTEKAEEETETRHREPEKDAAMERREAIAAEITAMLVEQAVADTTVKATEKGITITLSNIQFLADSARLHLSEMAKLQDIANILKNIYGIKIEVSGHTALAGTEESRLNISRERAQVVASYLVLLGACAEEDISYIGYGATRPIADNSTEEGMALNRRVEIILLEN